MKKLTTISALVSLLAASAFVVGCGSATDAQAEPQAPVASAQAPLAGEPGEHGHHGGGMFRRFDQDGDGKVALSDLPERAREHMKNADTNGDGYLTKDEVKAAREAHHAKMQAMMDTDGDGKVSDDERKAAHQKFEEEWQKRVDTNHDGTVSDDERAAARAKWGGRHEKERMDTNHDGTISDEERAAARSKFEEKFKEKADTNHDGTVSDDERKAAFAAFRDKKFERADKNGDGAITEDEVKPRMWQHIVAADANKDGKVDKTEIATLPMPEPGKRFGH